VDNTKVKDLNADLILEQAMMNAPGMAQKIHAMLQYSGSFKPMATGGESELDALFKQFKTIPSNSIDEIEGVFKQLEETEKVSGTPPSVADDNVESLFEKVTSRTPEFDESEVFFERIDRVAPKPSYVEELPPPGKCSEEAASAKDLKERARFNCDIVSPAIRFLEDELELEISSMVRVGMEAFRDRNMAVVNQICHAGRQQAPIKQSISEMTSWWAAIRDAQPTKMEQYIDKQSMPRPIMISHPAGVGAAAVALLKAIERTLDAASHAGANAFNERDFAFVEELRAYTTSILEFRTAAGDVLSQWLSFHAEEDVD
jgi:hypothetical protein